MNILLSLLHFKGELEFVKFIVVSSTERDIELEEICDTRDEAIKVVTNLFLNHHRYAGIGDDNIENMKNDISEYGRLETNEYGFYTERLIHAWSNVDPNYSYDIKVFVIQ